MSISQTETTLPSCNILVFSMHILLKTFQKVFTFYPFHVYLSCRIFPFSSFVKFCKFNHNFGGPRLHCKIKFWLSIDLSAAFMEQLTHAFLVWSIRFWTYIQYNKFGHILEGQINTCQCVLIRYHLRIFFILKVFW